MSAAATQRADAAAAVPVRRAKGIDMESADFERFFRSLMADDGPGVCPDKLARALHLRKSELATLCATSPARLRLAPHSPRIQRGLRDIVRVLSCAHARFDQLEALLFWFNHYPLQRFAFLTPGELCASGQCESLLHALRDGTGAGVPRHGAAPPR